MEKLQWAESIWSWLLFLRFAHIASKVAVWLSESRIVTFSLLPGTSAGERDICRNQTVMSQSRNQLPCLVLPLAPARCRNSRLFCITSVCYEEHPIVATIHTALLFKSFFFPFLKKMQETILLRFITQMIIQPIRAAARHINRTIRTPIKTEIMETKAVGCSCNVCVISRMGVLCVMESWCPVGTLNRTSTYGKGTRIMLLPRDS